ncbi:hypothetical protein [Streptomyces sp. GC420]|uniref:hypothetical protein n=1 Tax=Streptomyces sp. GC420 TaxID=2697568 RepID=UPI001415016C|nr:hypothetical protein [Streptomyces sp. GC420]NBM15630.1 hypothetical protein [Streptomyces sp. GC420]
MKYAKVAVAVAGSAMAAGIAAPAVAADAMPVPTSLTGGVNTLSSSPLSTPLRNDSLDTEKPGSLAHNAGKVLGEVNREVEKGGAAKLLGGLPLGR